MADTEDRPQPSPSCGPCSTDRFLSQDDTFGQLSDVTGSSLWLS